MQENQRESFRIDGEPFRAELFHEGKVAPCSVENLSAGGASVSSSMSMPVGSQCTVGVRLADSLRGDGVGYVSFLMEVLEAAAQGESFQYRLRNTTAPGSTQFEAATKLVFEAQRRRRAGATGTDEASPMVTDQERRRRLRTDPRPRFSKGSLRPDSDPD
jgi:hypothetical protein